MTNLNNLNTGMHTLNFYEGRLLINLADRWAVSHYVDNKNFITDKISKKKLIAELSEENRFWFKTINGNIVVILYK